MGQVQTLVGYQGGHLVRVMDPEKFEQDRIFVPLGWVGLVVLPGCGRRPMVSEVVEVAPGEAVFTPGRKVLVLLSETGADLEPGETGLLGCFAQHSVFQGFIILHRAPWDLDPSIGVVGVAKDEQHFTASDVGDYFPAYRVDLISSSTWGLTNEEVSPRDSPR